MDTPDVLLEKIVLQQVYLQRHKNDVIRRVNAALDASHRRVAAALQGADLTVLSRARLELLLRQIRGLVDADYEAVLKMLVDEIRQLEQIEAATTTGIIRDSLPVVVDLVTPSLETISAAVEEKKFLDEVLDVWMEKAKESARERVVEAVKSAVIEGNPVSVVVRELLGTEEGGHNDGVAALSRRGAAAMVRTMLTHVSVTAREEVYKQNSHVIKGVQWVSTLDSRTTPICISRDGNVYPIGKGPRPPAHINCRSTTVPITKSWAELGAVGDFPEKVGATRASMTGAVPIEMTYADWFAKQSPEIQDEILGKKKAALYRGGELFLANFFVDDKSKLMTLKQLQEKYPVEWGGVFKESAVEGLDDSLADSLVPAFDSVAEKAIEGARLVEGFNVFDARDFKYSGEYLRKFKVFVEDSNALDFYVGDGYRELNGLLREVSRKEVLDSLTDGEAENILKVGEKLRELMVPLPDPLVVFRGAPPIDGAVVGDVLKGEGFTSTSLSRETAAAFAYNSDYYDMTEELILYEIRLPTGTRAIPVSMKNRKNIEREVVLEDGQKFRILEIRKNITLSLHDSQRRIGTYYVLEAIP